MQGQENPFPFSHLDSKAGDGEIKVHAAPEKCSCTVEIPFIPIQKEKHSFFFFFFSSCNYSAFYYHYYTYTACDRLLFLLVSLCHLSQRWTSQRQHSRPQPWQHFRSRHMLFAVCSDGQLKKSNILQIVL